jgi:alkaline phosphatase D
VHLSRPLGLPETNHSQLPNFPYNPFTAERIKGWDVLNQYIWPHANFSTVVTEAFKNITETISSITSDKASNVSSVGLSISSAASSAVARLSSATISVTSIFAKTARSTSQITPDFMLFVGDFICVDLPNWGGGNLERYHQLYKRIYASPSFRKVYEKLRKSTILLGSHVIDIILVRHSTAIFTAWGDRDIINHFAGEDLDNKGPFVNASSAYLTFLGNANPDPVGSDVHYYNFRYGDNAFFVLDTRRHRTEPKAKVDVGGIHIEQQNSTTATTGGDDLYTPKQHTMLGDKQLTALYSWLGKVNSTTTFKFIVSSVPFTTLWKGLGGTMDGWAAYPEERSALLDVLEYVPNVIIISGDRHQFAAIQLRGKILEISGVRSPILPRAS